MPLPSYPYPYPVEKNKNNNAPHPSSTGKKSCLLFPADTRYAYKHTPYSCYPETSVANKERD